MERHSLIEVYDRDRDQVSEEDEGKEEEVSNNTHSTLQKQCTSFTSRPSNG